MNKFNIGDKINHLGAIGIVRDMEPYCGEWEYAIEFEDGHNLEGLPGCKRLVTPRPIDTVWIIPAGKGQWIDEDQLEAA